jgi:signal peptidase I
MMTVALALGFLAGTVALIGYLLRRRLLVITVEGVSMEPTYHAGDRLLVRRASLPAVRRGTVVVFAAPAGAPPTDPPLMVKRAVAIPGDPVPLGVPVPDRLVPAGHLVVVGDNAAHSADSRTNGFLQAADIVGIVIRSPAMPT